MAPTSPWKKPDEVMKLHRLKKRKKALQERLSQPFSRSDTSSCSSQAVDLNFSKIINGDKRRNPFSKTNNQQSKKVKTSDDISPIDESNDKTLLALINLSSAATATHPKHVDTDKLSTFSNLLQKYTADHNNIEQVTETRYKSLPIDWALKTRLRLMSPKPFPWNQQLKASEEASGITGFVRCLDTKSSSTLDTSPRARFHQTCLYWQHPHLPWLNLYPRTSARISGANFIANNEEVKQALYKEWTESFRSLFQSLRARHCPYFYMCAGAFTCLFRAAGLCGQTEMDALVAPTTRGLRHALRQEDIEFEMPLRPEDKRKLNNSDSHDNKQKNTSADSCYDTMDDTKGTQEQAKSPADGSGDEEDLDSDNFLSQMGFEAEDIKKINNTQARLQQCTESAVDSAGASLVVARGADAQALFNWLLVCRTATGGGAGAGVPPTLLAPTAFQGGTLQALSIRESTVHAESGKYHSVEVRGPLLPSVTQALLGAVSEACAAPYSATFAHHPHTPAFTAATASSATKDDSSKENETNNIASAFNTENLSDCGMSEQMLKKFCSADPSLIRTIDSVKYNKEDDSYTW